MKKLSALLSFFFLAIFTSLGQEYPMLHYSFEDGLPSNTVYQVYKDSKGFLWIATDKGIAKYNGVRFYVYTMFDGLPDNEIYFFKEDHQGRLWMGAANGKLCFYKNGVFHTAQNTPFLKINIDRPHITCITQEYDSSLTIHYYDQTILVNIYKDKVRIIDLNNVKEPHLFGGIYQRKLTDNRYVIYGRSGDFVIDSSYNILSTTKRGYDIKLKMTFLSQNSECIINEKFVYDLDLHILKSISNSVFCKYMIYNVNYYDSNYFFCTGNGLYMNDSICVIKDADVSSVTQDNFGNYWVSTLNSGIYYLRKDFLQTMKYNNVYAGNITYCKLKDNHIYYVNLENNLFDFYNGKIKTIFNYEKYIKSDFVHRNSSASYIDNDYRYYNFCDSNNIIIDNITKKNLKIHLYKQDFFLWGLKNVITDSDKMYVFSRNIVSKVNYNIKHKNNFIDYTLLIDSFERERIYNVSKNKRNEIWYNTAKNIYKICNDIYPVPQTQFKSFSLKSFDFLGDHILGYTFSNDLLLFSNVYGKMKVDTIKTEHCVWNKLYKLNDSMMLISTNNFDRLLTLHPNYEKKFSLSVIEDPLVPLNIDALYVDKNTCYFFKNGSVTSMSLSSLLRKNVAPVLFFSFLKTNRRSYFIQPEIELPFSESKNISISFSSHSFAGKDVYYLYSVTRNGVDNWRPVAGEELNLINSAYGDYVIKIKASTLGSGYSTPVFFKLRILKPYWATWWFISLCVLALILFAGFIVWMRILFVLQKNKKKHEQEMKFVKSEYKALNALMNPHFIFNTLNNVQGLFNANDREAANEYLRVFADLIRQNMHNVSKELIPLQREIALVMNYLMLEKLRFEDKLNYIINVDENIDTSDFMVPPLLIQPLVENSIKHGILPMKEQGGTVMISIYEERNMLCIEVKDNGVGINHTKKVSGIMHESFGMENIKKRIEQLSIIQNKQITFAISEINDDAGNHLWTIAVIRMPL